MWVTFESLVFQECLKVLQVLPYAVPVSTELDLQ